MRDAFAVAGRILQTVQRDRRTLGLIVVAPVLILFLFGQVFDEVEPGGFNTRAVHPVFLGVFVFMLTYLLTAIGFLRERQSGTFERVQATAVSRSSLVTGYVLGYGALALVQMTALVWSGIFFLDVTFEHSFLLFVLIDLLGAATALGLGILLSLAAQNEFQVIQFIPIVFVPQFILGGVFIPVDALPGWLEPVARILPLTYLLQGMNWVVLGLGEAADFWIAAGVLAAFTVASLGIGAAVVKRVA